MLAGREEALAQTSDNPLQPVPDTWQIPAFLRPPWDERHAVPLDEECGVSGRCGVLI